MENQAPGTLARIIQMANPAFIIAVIVVPIGALLYADIFGPTISLNYVHILAGATWTGIDLFMGFVLGPAMGRMSPENRVAVFKHLMPKMTFLMPVLAGVTITSGIQLAQRLDYDLFSPLFIAAFIITGILTIQGFGILLPNEIQIFRQLLSERPDTGRISQLGMRNARLGGIQGLLQLVIIFIMAAIRI